MLPFFKKSKKVDNFEPAKLRESAEKLNNPFRGWYEIFYFVLGEDMDFESVKRRMDLTDSLSMVFIDIAALGKESLGGDHEKAVRTILDFFADSKRDIILRIAYDHEGKCMQREPLSFGVIEMHAKAIIDIVSDYDNVFVLQGLMVGNWGEMHSSRFMMDEYLKKIADIYSQNKQTYMAVRRPSQWRVLNTEYNKNRKETYSNMGIFDDAIFASETDLGTFSNVCKNDCGYRSEWLRNEEIDFLGELGNRNPVGGELLYSEGYSDKLTVSQIKKDMADMHITYLNKEYDRRVLDKWQKIPAVVASGIWVEKSLFEYVEAHMGYRFLIEKVSLTKEENGICVNLEIRNNGFAPAYRNSDIYVEITDGENSEIQVIQCGLNEIKPNETKIVNALFTKTKGKVKAYGKSGERIIRFANETEEKDKILLGRLV